MKFLTFLALTLTMAVSAMSQVTIQQPPGTYTNNSIPVRDGTANKVKNSNLLYASNIMTLADNSSADTAILLNAAPTGFARMRFDQGGGRWMQFDYINDLFTFQGRDGDAFNIFTYNNTGAGTNPGDFEIKVPLVSPDITIGNTANAASGNAINLENAALLGWEANPAGTDLTLGVNASNVLASSAPFTAPTGTFPSTASLLLGTAGSAVGNIGFRNATSGTATLAPPTGALGTYSVTLPNAASTLPIFGQQITFTGPSTARTVTFPDANFTAARTDAANTFTGVQSMTSPAITTSITTPSTTFALYNTTATTINAFGAATTLNFGASATQILNFGGSTTASQFRFLEPSGSGTNYSAFLAQAQSANITYTLPSTVGAAGEVLSDPAGNGTLDWVAAGAGTVTVVSAGSLTSTALVTGGGSQTLQTPAATATMDSSGNISTPGTISSGSSSSVAGALDLDEGTAQSLVANHFLIYAPADVAAGGLAYVTPGAAATGFLLATDSSGTMTLSHVSSTGTGNVVREGSPTLTGTLSVPTIQLGATGVNITNDSDGAITLLGSSAGSDEDMTINLDDTANTIVVSSSTGVTTINTGAIGLVSTGPSSIGPLVDAVDGTTPLNNLLSAYGAGTAYAFTNAAAAIDFGTTDPSITLSNAGTYTIYAQIHVAYAGATVVAETATLTVRRTNNTAADLGQSIVIDLPASTVLTESYGTVNLPPFSYTTAVTNDALTINALVSATLSAGTINATAVGTSIIAIRRY